MNTLTPAQNLFYTQSSATGTGLDGLHPNPSSINTGYGLFKSGQLEVDLTDTGYNVVESINGETVTYPILHEHAIAKLIDSLIREGNLTDNLQLISEGFLTKLQRKEVLKGKTDKKEIIPVAGKNLSSEQYYQNQLKLAVIDNQLLYEQLKELAKKPNLTAYKVFTDQLLSQLFPSEQLETYNILVEKEACFIALKELGFSQFITFDDASGEPTASGIISAIDWTKNGAKFAESHKIVTALATKYDPLFMPIELRVTFQFPEIV